MEIGECVNLFTNSSAGAGGESCQRQSQAAHLLLRLHFFWGAYKGARICSKTVELAPIYAPNFLVPNIIMCLSFYLQKSNLLEFCILFIFSL